VIEHNCWLGVNAVVLKGVRIGHHSTVGANAVVTRDVPPRSVVAGVPARVIGSQKPPERRDSKEKIEREAGSSRCASQ
jgi:acetyltransferase-like isoleucine patch superfamily enzyme